jgi:hypothetical protein
MLLTSLVAVAEGLIGLAVVEAEEPFGGRIPSGASPTAAVPDCSLAFFPPYDARFSRANTTHANTPTNRNATQR